VSANANVVKLAEALGVGIQAFVEPALRPRPGKKR
jgi:hypothetical protein